MVHLEPAPLTRTLSTNKKDAGNKSQKLKLFMRGKLMSAEEHIRGINQFLNLLIRKGMIKKNTMITL